MIKHVALGAARLLGRALQTVVVACLAVSIIALPFAIANYSATQGSGTTYSSVVLGGTVHYFANMLCDFTVGETQCAAVSAGGAVKVDNSAVTQPVSGTVTANAGTNLNTSSIGATTDTPCTLPASSTACSLTAINKAVANTVNGPISAGTAVIGAVTIPGGVYNTVAAGSTATVLSAVAGGGTGATGDYLSHCVLYPTALNTGVVTIFDSTASATNDVILFAGGSPSVSNLTPISVPVGAFSVNGAWKVTTGTAISVTCYGKFH